MSTPLVTIASAAAVMVSVASFSPAWADDDDWHSQAQLAAADQPQRIAELEAIPRPATAPTHETVYAPARTNWVVSPNIFQQVAFQTAGAARPR